MVAAKMYYGSSITPRQAVSLDQSNAYPLPESNQEGDPMTIFSWMIVAFDVFMAGVCLFTYVQIERNAHQTRQRRLTREQDAQGQPTA